MSADWRQNHFYSFTLFIYGKLLDNLRYFHYFHRVYMFIHAFMGSTWSLCQYNDLKSGCTQNFKSFSFFSGHPLPPGVSVTYAYSLHVELFGVEGDFLLQLKKLNLCVEWSWGSFQPGDFQHHLSLPRSLQRNQLQALRANSFLKFRSLQRL